MKITYLLFESFNTKNQIILTQILRIVSEETKIEEVIGLM